MSDYGLTTNKGAFPIVVNGQLIGAMGAGGMAAPDGEEACVRECSGTSDRAATVLAAQCPAATVSAN